jgi:hypothetical protein
VTKELHISHKLKYWVLLVKHHGSDTWIIPEGDIRTYEIAPNGDIKKDDTVYLWWIAHSYFYGWGEVAKSYIQENL